MRDDFGRNRTSVLVWLLCAVVAGFFLQVVFKTAFKSDAFDLVFQLSTRDILAWEAWRFLTYPLLHDNILHVAFNSLTLYFLGRELHPYLGEKRLLGFIIGAAALGGLLWFAVNFHRDSVVIGASAIAMAFLILFACFNPNREITFLFLFFPVTIKPKYLAYIVLGIDVLGLLTGEIPGGRFDTGIAHSAHLGGALAAVLYFYFVHQREWRTPDRNPEMELPRWLKRSKAAPETAQPKFRVNLSNRADLRAEVDRILDKINSHGFASLTAEEKKLLDDAKDSLSRH